MKQLIISAGKYKGYKLTCPPGEIRPAMNVMREAVFQILDNTYFFAQNTDEGYTHTNNIRFLDLFSGSGLMAIEAVSRGIDAAVSVEMDKQKWAIIHKNISIAEHRIRIVHEAAEKFLLKNNKKFDIIYADPPFNYKYKNDLVTRIIKSRACDDDTIIIIHMPKKEPILEKYTNFQKVDSRNYGGSGVHFFRVVIDKSG